MLHPFYKPIENITQEDIQSLVQNRVSESRTLEYKRDLYTENERKKKDFLIDVSALANTAGGYLIIGIKEEKGVPQSIEGVEIPDFDKLKQQFENLLGMSVDPPIRGVEFHAIDMEDNKKVLIIEVPRSYSRPHAVIYNQHPRFHGRNASGTYPFEVDDIRHAILESETNAVKIRNFRNDRLSLISINEASWPLCAGAKFVLQLIPTSAFNMGANIQSGSVNKNDFPPVDLSNGYDGRINFDGYVIYDKNNKDNFATCYTQVFNNGIVEAVEGSMLRDRRDGKKTIPSRVFEERIIFAANTYLSSLKKYGIFPPIWLCVSLLGVKGYVMALSSSVGKTYPIDRNELILPEIPINTFIENTEQIFKPVFDLIWNACGFDGSLNYDENGKWNPQK